MSYHQLTSRFRRFKRFSRIRPMFANTPHNRKDHGVSGRSHPENTCACKQALCSQPADVIIDHPREGHVRACELHTSIYNVVEVIGDGE